MEYSPQPNRNSNDIFFMEKRSSSSFVHIYIYIVVHLVSMKNYWESRKWLTQKNGSSCISIYIYIYFEYIIFGEGILRVSGVYLRNTNDDDAMNVVTGQYSSIVCHHHHDHGVEIMLLSLLVNYECIHIYIYIYIWCMYQSADHINVKCEKLQQLFVVSVTSRLHVVSPFTIHGSCRSGNKAGPKKVPDRPRSSRTGKGICLRERVIMYHPGNECAVDGVHKYPNGSEHHAWRQCVGWSAAVREPWLSCTTRLTSICRLQHFHYITLRITFK